MPSLAIIGLQTETLRNAMQQLPTLFNLLQQD
jgi:hypothetical protein